jgi:hypothetical protein
MPDLKRFDRYTHRENEVVLILPNGTLANTEPVLRMIEKGLAIPTEWRKALDKTLSQET